MSTIIGNCESLVDGSKIFVLYGTNNTKETKRISVWDVRNLFSPTRCFDGIFSFIVGPSLFFPYNVIDKPNGIG